MKFRRYLLTVSLLLLSTQAWSVCLTERSHLLPKWFYELTGRTPKKRCSLNEKTKNTNNVQDLAIKAERLSTRCAKSWTATTDEKGKEYTLPAGLRVIRLDDSPESRVLFYINGQAHEGTIPAEAFSGKKDCPQKEERPSLQAFFEEATFALQLTKVLATKNPKTLPQLLRVEEALAKMKNRKDFDDLQFQNFNKSWQETLAKAGTDKVARVASYQNLISSSFDPILSDGRTMSEGTLLVPISQEWFLSNPKLAKFYQATWLDSKLDPRIAAGASGEGVIYYQNNVTENDSFLESAGLLEKTNEFLQSEPDLKNSPEGQWLKTQSVLGYKSHTRLIFFSPKTWTNSSKDNSWADSVPVDQSLGGVSSDYLMSVMIHEINVNSNGFLPSDTHLLHEDTIALQNCLKKYGIDDMEKDPATLQALFGFSPQLSTVTAKILLDQMDQGPKTQ